MSMILTPNTTSESVTDTTPPVVNAPAVSTQMTPSRLLQPDQSVLLIVDIQEKFAPVMPNFMGLLERTVILAEAAKQLNIPIVVTEQYKKGLGETVSALRDVLPPAVHYFDKTTFGAIGEQKIAEYLPSLKRPQIILCGLEAHVCVSQTAHQLLAAGFQVHLMSDAISSRTAENRKIGLDKMQQSGAIPSCVEMAIFELLQDAKHGSFKAIQSLIK